MEGLSFLVWKVDLELCYSFLGIDSCQHFSRLILERGFGPSLSLWTLLAYPLIILSSRGFLFGYSFICLTGYYAKCFCVVSHREV